MTESKTKRGIYKTSQDSTRHHPVTVVFYTSESNSKQSSLSTKNPHAKIRTRKILFNALGALQVRPLTVDPSTSM